MVVSLVLENSRNLFIRMRGQARRVVRRRGNKLLLVAVRLLCQVKTFPGGPNFSAKTLKFAEANKLRSREIDKSVTSC